MNTTTQNSSNDSSNRVPQRSRVTPDNWRVHRGGRREQAGFHWSGSRSQVALLGTIGRPFA